MRPGFFRRVGYELPIAIILWLVIVAVAWAVVES